MDIKNIMDTPNYDKEQILRTQKLLLEQKRNRLNGIITKRYMLQMALNVTMEHNRIKK